MKKAILILLLSLPLLVPAQQNPVRIALHTWATGLSKPVFATHAGDERLFVVLRQGTIRIVADSMQVLPVPFLNITPLVQSASNEQGLLGLAFDPGYADNGYFYVYYTHGSGPGVSRISRFQVSADPNVADASSEVVLYTVPQPFTNHNGGCLQFGPDGYLYCGFGDGGDQNDPQGNAQNLGAALGKMIRIDVSQHTDTYAIPPDNPFVATAGALPEVWASGLRNPWRFSFDALAGDLWIGDVGQNQWEEVDFWPAGNNNGPNFGWRCREAYIPTPGVNQSGCAALGPFVEPVAAFDHGQQGWCSVIGGYVYRGTRFPHLFGKYIFTDYCNGDFLSFGENFDVDTLLQTDVYGFSGFGQDAAGELYVTDVEHNLVKKVVDACPMPDPEIDFDGATLTSTAADSWQWYLGGVAITGATGMSFEPVIDGMYQVLASFGDPCTLYSEPLQVVVTGLSGPEGFGPSVFPQPASSSVQVRTEVPSRVEQVLELFDMQGQVVRTVKWPIGAVEVSVHLAGLADGSYMLRGSHEGVPLWTRTVQLMR